jgi:asparagine synthase (glutamine-hydrolysing)
MSGIAGIYYLDGRPVEQTDVQRMVDSISHRGPDGFGVWTDGSVGLGHRMLWTTPESLHEKLPLTNKTGDLTITADARIDNRDELIPTLNLNGRPRETIPDSEIILAAYEKWGEQCPEKLLGDFSFAIWDKRNHKIYCARDPIGIKPFYYYFKEGKFRWSSEPKAIFEDKAIPKEPNLPLICLYLLNRFDEREETLYKDVYRLPPSHSMTIENGRIRKDQYWDIDPNYSIRYKTDEEYAEHFLSLFKEAVRARLRSHGPVGALLSGGLDSSSIVCTAAKLYQDSVIPNNGFETFSFIFDTFPCDERVYVDEIVRKWNIHANSYTYEKHLSSFSFDQIYEYFEGGYFWPLLPSAPALRDAKQKRIKVMLNGIGGDELLAAGFNHLTDLMFEGNFRKLIIQIRNDAKLSSYSLLTLFFNYCFKPLIPQSFKIPLKYVLNLFHRNGIPSWINFDYFKRASLAELPKHVKFYIKFPTRSQQQIYERLRNGWNINVALDIIERFNAHFGFEVRYPFFCRHLVQFCLALTQEQRSDTQCTKVVLRRAMEGVLPDLVKKRTDLPAYSSVVDWELKIRQADRLEKLILTSALSTLGLIYNDQLYRLLKYYQKSSNTSYQISNTLETFIWLELWYRSFTGNFKREEESYD